MATDIETNRGTFQIRLHLGCPGTHEYRDLNLDPGTHDFQPFPSRPDPFHPAQESTCWGPKCGGQFDNFSPRDRQACCFLCFSKALLGKHCFLESSTTLIQGCDGRKGLRLDSHLMAGEMKERSPPSGWQQGLPEHSFQETPCGT